MAKNIPQNQGFPQISAPIVDNSGKLTLTWYQFFISLWNRTGGTQGQPGPFIPSDVAITGGSINGTTIGLTTPEAGLFTTLQATGTLSASNFSGSSSGTNTGNVTLTGQNYLTISGQQINAHQINLGSNVTGQLATGNLPVSGLSVTITTAQLTSMGTQGSMTFTNGILTAQTQAT